MPPYLFQFAKKSLVILDMPQLIRVLIVPFEVPVRWRGNDEVNGFVLQEGQIPRVSIDQSVICG
jgi:hypothetical protein